MERRARGVRLITLTVLAACVWALSLRFVFPGYLDPFAIYHIDHFAYIGMARAGYGAVLPYVLSYPRPVAHILMHQCGLLGMGSLLVPLFLASCLNAALLVRYLERVTGLSVPLPCFILFTALAYAHPQFYWNLKADPFAVFSLTLLLAIAHSWQSYVESGRRWFLAAAMALTLPFGQTKESYFCVLALFILIQLVAVPQRRKAAVALLVVSATSMGFGLFRAAQLWTLFQPRSGPKDPYYTTLAPDSVIRGLLEIGDNLFVPIVVVALIGVFITSWFRDRRAFFVAMTAVVFAVASLLPNATLPNHLEAQYAGLGVYFMFASFLLLAGLMPHVRLWKGGLVLGGLAFYGLVLLAYREQVVAEAGWLRNQEVVARQLVKTLGQMKHQTEPGESVLVAGMTMPFNPYRAPDFIYSEMGPRRWWTVVVSDPADESVNRTTRLIHASSPAMAEHYDRLFVIHPDGHLAESLAKPDAMAVSKRLAGISGGVPNGLGRLRKDSQHAAEPMQFGKAELYARPNPVHGTANGLGRTRIHWVAPSATTVEVRVGAPNGPLFATGGPSGSAETGDWVKDGIVFYLQDGSRGNSNAPEQTVATLRVPVEGSGAGSASR